MMVYLIWIGATILALGLYSLFLWRRSHKRSRFQARLSILFFLFALIPTVPLTLFVSLVITESTEFLILPGVEPALSQSMETIRSLLQHRSELFFLDHPQVRSVEPAQLERIGACYTGEILWRDQKGEYGFFSSVDAQFRTPPEEVPSLTTLQSLKTYGRAVGKGTSQVYEAFQLRDDSTMQFVGFRLSEEIINAKENLTLALKNVSSLNFLRETFIEQGLIWTGAVVFIMFLALTSVLLARAIARGISEPIQRLTEGMQRVGAGDLSHRVQVKAVDELEFLVRSFNQMAEELKFSRENLQRAERAAAWRDVARQVSHEIKNPLTPIQFSLYRLRSSLPEELAGQPDLDESFRVIEEEITSMRRIADEFAEFAQMPLLDLKIEEVAEIVRRSAHLFEGEVHKITLKVEIDDNLPAIPIDRHQLRRAIHNLLKNAVEASRPGDTVTLRAQATGRSKPSVIIQVIDHGHGMDESTRQRALDPYFTTKSRGSGLGLFIVQRIVNDHGGHVHIASEVNRGTTVTITL